MKRLDPRARAWACSLLLAFALLGAACSGGRTGHPATAASETTTSTTTTAAACKVINLAANSNYGQAFKLFQSTYLGGVTRRTTVIVIGDGRGNYNPPNAWALAEIKRKAKRLIWLCPEEQHSWGFGDSEMPLYARNSTRVESVRSLDDLNRVADELMP